MSRPLLLALAAVIALAGAWLVVIRPQSAGGPPVPSVSRPTAPGAGGLTRAIAKADGAVAASAADARRVPGAGVQNAPRGPRPTSSPAGPGAPAPPTRPRPTPAGAAAATPAAASGAVHGRGRAATPGSPRTPGGAPTDRSGPLLQELAQGRVVVLLFWNPASTDDRAVRRAVLEDQGDGRHRGVAVHVVPVTQVASFGAITQGIPVLQSPTVLVIAPNRRAITVTGYTDAREIEQRVGEALSAVHAR